MKTIRLNFVFAVLVALGTRAAPAKDPAARPWDWTTALPESQGMSTPRLESAWTNLLKRATTAFLVIRNDKIVFERYAPGYSRTKPHGTASMAKALVGGVSLILAVYDEWSVGYETTYQVEGLPLVATWGGAAYSPNATARVSRLMLYKGNWEGKSVVAPSAVEAATRHSRLPGHSGLGWWANVEFDGRKLWKSAPEDAFWGAGAGHQFLFVVPSLNLIVVRNGEQLDQSPTFADALERHVVDPVMRAFVDRR
jgi:hypothetical protein